MHPHLTSIIIVTADSGVALVECVTCAFASEAAVELIVSDNASTDGSIEALIEKYPSDPRLSILRNGSNLGFSCGVNRGAAVVQGDALLILNPDCFLETNTLTKLREILDRHPDAGLIGVSICDAKGFIDPASRRRDPLLRRALMTLSGLARFEKFASVFTGINIPDERSSQIEKVEAVSGALMLIRRKVFDHVNGFDEGYFLHCEDLDLCRRIRDAGFSVLYAGDIHVRHGKGGSSHHRPLFVSWHKHRSMWRWFCKFDPAARNELNRIVVWSGIWMRFLLTVPGCALSASRHRNRLVTGSPTHKLESQQH